MKHGLVIVLLKEIAPFLEQELNLKILVLKLAI